MLAKIKRRKNGLITIECSFTVCEGFLEINVRFFENTFFIIHSNTNLMLFVLHVKNGHSKCKKSKNKGNHK
jgi:hypothetical protein